MKLRALACLGLIFPMVGFGYTEAPAPLPKKEANTVKDVLLAGDLAFRFRARYEYDDVTPVPGVIGQPLYDGQVATLSTRLRYNTAWFCDIFGLLDFDNVSAFATNKFNSGANTTPSHFQNAVIPDPRGSALVQAYVVFAGLSDTSIVVGRQELSLDDERFVGYNDFRQTPQTYNAISLVNRSLENAELFYAYIDAFNTVWQGNEAAFDRVHNMATHLFNVSAHIRPFGDFVSYAYLINDHTVPYNSTNSYGLRYYSDYEVPHAMVYTLLEYAYQNSNHENPNPFHANYYHMVGGTRFLMFDLGSGLEILCGNNSMLGKAFRTPLATKHGANGLADQFKITPNAGLKDSTYYAKVKYWNIDAFVQYHYFRAQSGSAVFGHEWDAGISRPFFKNYFVGVEYADFTGRPNNGFTDIKKVWVTLAMEF